MILNSVLLSLILAATAAPFELTTLDEQTARGDLMGLSAQTATLRTVDGEVKFDIEQLLLLAPVETAAAGNSAGDIVVEFADGSSIQASGYAVKSGQATITLADDDELKVSARRIRAVRFLQQDEREQSLWNDIVASDPKGDVVVVRKGGDGKSVTLDFLEGALRDVSEATVQFEFDGDVVPVNRTKVKVEGLLYYQRDNQQQTKAVCRIDDIAGGHWMATSVKLDGEDLEFTTASGINRTVPLASVTNLDFSLGKIAFLGDLEPVKKTWQPYLGSASVSDRARQLFDVRRDQNFAGDTITIGDKKFRKGLAIHSRTEISYRLPGEFSRFEAVAGIDPSQRSHGNVRLVVRGDGRVLFNETIAGEAAPTLLQLDVTGVGRLTVLVDYGEGWDIGDQLLLGGARVIR